MSRYDLPHIRVSRPRGALTAVAALLLTACGSMPVVDTPAPSPLAIDQMRGASYPSTLIIERALPPAPDYRAYLAKYDSSGLNVYALIAVPNTPARDTGYPVLIANHGFHPDPPRYGVRADGTDLRPGDDYRDILALFAREGYLVVMPDYRGHNSSEGLDYAGGPLATRYYTQDVLALLPGIERIEQADPANVFMWGHSMGGDVTLRALVTTDAVRAASLWSPMTGSVWEWAFHYNREDGVNALRDAIDSIDPPHDPRTSDALEHLHYLRTPLIIHHAAGDASVPFGWSERLAAELNRLAKPYTFHDYPGDDHLFAGDELATAIARDVAFFRRQAAHPSGRRQQVSRPIK